MTLGVPRRKFFTLLLIHLILGLAGCSPATTEVPPTATILPPTTEATIVPSPTTTKPPPSPTPTEVLSPEEQREIEFGHFVPKGEACVSQYEAYIPGETGSLLQPNAAVAELIMHATDIKTDEAELELDREKRKVRLLQVICRDDDGNMEKPVWLNLGGLDFGKNRDGKVIYWVPEGLAIVHPDEILARIKPGSTLSLTVLIKPGSGNLSRVYYAHGGGNDLARLALQRFADDKDQIDLLTTGIGVTEDDFILTPVRITIYD